MAYKPVQINLGYLPEFPNQAKTYDFSSLLPGEVKEVLVYTFATTYNEGSTFQRGYFEMYTQQGEDKYKQYLNIATGSDIAAVNSANLWYPAGDTGKLTITLIHPADKKTSIAQKAKAACAKAGKSDDPMQSEWSGVFIIGYRL